ncbi:alpha/beta fold hydrolase [Streptomyces longwoodensis]|uniref:alpha/beta fold hydrolase n=1 Tax=Streptomyces longwoodensis TaxID=68231 RepID=UPI003F5760C1
MERIELTAGTIEYEDTGGDGPVLILLHFRKPVLVVWACEDRVVPPEHGRRLARLLADARLVEAEDSYTLVPLDRPTELTRVLREFTHALAPSTSSPSPSGSAGPVRRPGA